MPKPARRPRDDDDEDEDDDRRPRRSSRRRDEDDEDDDIPPGTPRVYVHLKCHRKTRMPDDVIVAYLDNPFAFGHQTNCSYCDKVVPWEKCEWVESGENLLDYFEDMQARMLLSGRDPREDQGARAMIFIGPLMGVVMGGGAGAFIASRAEVKWVWGALIGIPIGVGIAAAQWFRERRDYAATVKKYDRQLFKKFYARHPDEKPGKKRKSRRDDD
jgi:hypothetical protein